MILVLAAMAALACVVLLLGALMVNGASAGSSRTSARSSRTSAKSSRVPPESSRVTTESSAESCAKAAGGLGSMPSWVDQDTALSQNSKTVKDADTCFDFLLYGDSITAFLTVNAAVLKKHFGGKKAAALGVGGNTVEQLAWRIMSGSEAPALAPKCVAFNIGVNNTTRSQGEQVTTAHMETLLRWWQKAYPSTKLVLMALLPTSRVDRKVAETNRRYKALASKLGIVFAECGQDMDADDTSLFSDGLHPTTAGHDAVLKCLRKIVDPYI